MTQDDYRRLFFYALEHGMTPDALRELNSLYVRYVRLTELKSRYTRSDKAMIYWLRMELEDRGMDLSQERTKPI